MTAAALTSSALETPEFALQQGTRRRAARGALRPGSRSQAAPRVSAERRTACRLVRLGLFFAHCCWVKAFDCSGSFGVTWANADEFCADFLAAGYTCDTRWSDACPGDNPGGPLFNSYPASFSRCSQCSGYGPCATLYAHADGRDNILDPARQSDLGSSVRWCYQVPTTKCESVYRWVHVGNVLQMDPYEMLVCQIDAADSTKCEASTQSCPPCSSSCTDVEPPSSWNINTCQAQSA